MIYHIVSANVGNGGQKYPTNNIFKLKKQSKRLLPAMTRPSVNKEKPPHQAVNRVSAYGQERRFKVNASRSAARFFARPSCLNCYLNST